jgi:hypothetical protein
MKVADLVSGMLVTPVRGKGWWPILSESPSHFPDHLQYMKTNNIQNCKNGRDPAIYLGKKIFEEPIHGLYTYHQLLYNGIIFMIDGYEFHGRIDPL